MTSSAEVLQVLCVGKHSDGNLNEDGYTVTDDIIAVFDGSTDKTGSSPPTPGRQATLSLLEAVPDIGQLSNPEEVVNRLHEAVASVVHRGVVNPSAVGAIIHITMGKVIRIGDISVGINGHFDIPNKRIDQVAAAARVALLRSRLLAGDSVTILQETDPGRNMILPLLIESKQWRNRDDSLYGFATIDGRGTPMPMVDIFDIPSGSEIILASDGYVSPQSTLEESERMLQGLLARDPLRLESPPGTKGILPGRASFDDRTYVRVRLHGN